MVADRFMDYTALSMVCIAQLAFLITLGVTADAIIIGSVRNQPGDDRPDGDNCHDEDRSRQPVTQGCKSPLTATPSTRDLDYMR